MDIGALKTDVVTFETPITLIRKVKNSIAIVQEKQLMFCAPFSLNRAFTGIHHAKYTHNFKIEDVTFILSNSKFINNPLIEEFDNPNGVPPEIMLLIYDQNETFFILDPARQVTVCSFTLPLKDRIISMTGSTTLLNTFVIITPSLVIRYEANPGVARILEKKEVWSRRVLPFNDNFLLLSKDSITVYRSGSISPVYEGVEIDNFCISDDKSIIISRRDKNCISCHNSIFENISKPDLPVIGMKNCLDGMWDVAGNWAVSVLSDDIIAIANLYNAKAKTAFKMNSQIDVVKYMFAGIMRAVRALGVIIFGTSRKKDREWLLEIYQVPLDNLEKL